MDGSDTLASVLVVDYDVALRDLLVWQLNKLCVRADLVLSGEDALSLIPKRKYKIVFLDLDLPDIQGYEVARRIRSLEEECTLERPALIAMSSNFDVSLCRASGFDECAQKPFFLGTLKEILQVWMASQPEGQ